MLLNYLRIRIGVPYVSDLRYSHMWQDVLLCLSLDGEAYQMFSLHDWQEALMYLKGEELDSENPRDYLARLLL